MTGVTALRLELSRADVAACAGLMMICGGILLVLPHPAAQQLLRRITQSPEVQKAAAQIGRELLDSTLRAVGTASLSTS